ncbi:MAG: glycerophosphodiester phosphodiesterase [Acidimicrobiales bacterium]
MVDVFAHRGVHYSERENTLASFAAAVALGVDGVELDVRETLDGELVIHHDPVAGDLIISQTKGVELPSYIPSLADAFTVLAGLAVNVEIKNSRSPGEPTYDETGSFARRVVAEICEAGWSEQVIVSCFDLATCAVVRSFDRQINVGWLLWDVDLGSAFDQAREFGLNALNPHFSLVTSEVMREANELRLDINAWTVNGSSDIAAMAELGVASIITDDPTLALRVLANHV